jgi:hypothetical protein
MEGLNIDADSLIPGQRYVVTFYSNYHKKNVTFIGTYVRQFYGTIQFADSDNPEGPVTGTFSRAYLVSAKVYVNPQLPGPINQQINSYGGKRKTNRRKYRRSRKLYH